MKISNCIFRVITAASVLVSLTACSNSTGSSSSEEQLEGSISSESSEENLDSGSEPAFDEEEFASDYEYEIDQDLGGIVITKYIGDITVLTVPSEIGGNKVVKIGDQAFQKCRDLTSITISDGVTVVGSKAFADCT